MTKQTTSSVRLKGMADGLCVTLDLSQPANLLRKELNNLFKPLKYIAVNAKVSFDVGKHGDKETTIKELEEFLKKKFAVSSVTILPPKPSDGGVPVIQDEPQQLHPRVPWQQHQSDVLVLTGRVRSGQKVTAKKHLLILGDVNPGGEVIAGGDVFIMGILSGMAAAGQPDNEDSIVLAFDFRPVQVQIGGLVAAGLPPSSQKVVEFAHVENGVIVVEDYMKANPFGRLPWPEIR